MRRIGNEAAERSLHDRPSLQSKAPPAIDRFQLQVGGFHGLIPRSRQVDITKKGIERRRFSTRLRPG